VSPSTFKNYLQILEDTLIGFRLPGFTKTKKRKATVRAKHYLFDLGVTRHLAKAGMIRAKSKEFGDAFEHFIILEVRAYLSYHRKKQEMSYWRSTSQFEVDLIIGGRIGIEIKSADLISDKHLKGLRALAEEKIMERLICIHTGHLASRSADGIEILPFQDFLTQLWAGDML
jgi:predicted AAA+ superfamily ATPase